MADFVVRDVELEKLSNPGSRIGVSRCVKFFDNPNGCAFERNLRAAGAA